VAFFTNIIHRFRVPNSIITDNGTQFTGKKFLDFYDDHHIRLARPQAPASGGGLYLPRPLDSASTPVSGGIASLPDPGLGLKRSLRLDRPCARTDRADRGCIIPLFLACSGYKE
jgi:hypothetical protein